MASKEAIVGILIGILVYSFVTKYSDIFSSNANRSGYDGRKDQDIHHEDACVYMQQKYNIRTIESFYELKIDVQEQFFKLGCSKILKSMEHGKKKSKINSDNELINEARKDTHINTNSNSYSKSPPTDEKKKNDLFIKKVFNNSKTSANSGLSKVNPTIADSKSNTDVDTHVDTHSVIIRCKEMRDAYHVDIGHSWGTLTMELQKQWSRMRCDLLLDLEDQKSLPPSVNITATTSNNDTKSNSYISSNFNAQELQSTNTKSNMKTDTTTTNAVVSNTAVSNTKTNTESKISSNINTISSFFLGNKDKKSDNDANEDTLGLFKVNHENVEWCNDNKAKYDVIPLRSWGRLPMNMVDEWKKRACDKVFTNLRMSKKKIVTCDPKTNMNSKLPLIAVMAASTTRKVTSPSVDNMAIFSFLFPSLIRTLDCNFRYVVVLGYDSNDPFYDTAEGMKSAVTWFDENIKKVMKKRGISIYLKTVKVNNTLRKPGPVFIEMARAAYKEGAHYFYRLNDDTELIDNWPSIFVGALNNLGKPYGVVGPTCRQGNQKILTHDFVHRLHMEIFEMNYYPAQLTDWWMDDWISFVYGQKRTFKAYDVKAIHHTGAHGQRYEVNQENGLALTSLIDQGRQKIRQWMLKNSISERLLTEFDNDIFDQNMVHKDIPKAAQL